MVTAGLQGDTGQQLKGEIAWCSPANKAGSISCRRIYQDLLLEINNPNNS